jgi:hypothetical protein
LMDRVAPSIHTHHNTGQHDAKSVLRVREVGAELHH